MTDTAETTATETRTHSRYPAYQDSGVDWLSDIAAHWEVKRVKFVAAIFKQVVQDAIRRMLSA